MNLLGSVGAVSSGLGGKLRRVGLNGSLAGVGALNRDSRSLGRVFRHSGGGDAVGCQSMFSTRCLWFFNLRRGVVAVLGNSSGEAGNGGNNGERGTHFD